MSEPTDTDGDVVLAPIIDLAIRRKDFCPHNRRKRHVDANRRTVECECGAQLDPFDVLLAVATEHENRTARLKQLDAEIKRAQERLDEIKRLEANARARVRRIAPELVPVKPWAPWAKP